MSTSSPLERLLPDRETVRQTFAQFPSGVACIGAIVGGEQEGLIVSSFTVGISMDPPLVSFAVQEGSRTWSLLREAPHLGVSIMARHHDRLIRQMASKDRMHRFDNVDVSVAQSGAIFLFGSPVWLECRLFHQVTAGDHTLVLLEVEGLGFDANVDPLVFHRSAFPFLSAQEVDSGDSRV